MGSGGRGAVTDLMSGLNNDLEPLTNFALFAGAGGLEQAAHYTGRVRTVGYCEFDPYAQGVLRSRIRGGELDDAPIWDDIRTLDGKPWRGLVDCLSGGFPCQDVSQAGARAGIKEGTRSGLWSHYARLIGEMEPVYVLAENVRGLLSGSDGRDFGRVLGDLADLGFDAQWYVLSAAAVGAPHRRERVWIIGWHRERERGWPTPNVADGRTDRLKSSQQTPGSMHSVTLAQAVQMWPTPRANSGTGAGTHGDGGLDLQTAVARATWPTPKAQEPGWTLPGATTEDGKTPDPNRRVVKGGVVRTWGLQQAVDARSLWPTPRAGKPGGFASPDHNPTLEQAVRGVPRGTDCRGLTGGQLNPTWVEWLMGWPLGWTALDSAETALFRSKRCRRGKSS